MREWLRQSCFSLPVQLLTTQPSVSLTSSLTPPVIHLTGSLTRSKGPFSMREDWCSKTLRVGNMEGALTHHQSSSSPFFTKSHHIPDSYSMREDLI